MGTVPTPYDAIPFHKLSAAELDSGIKTALDWLLNDYPRVHAYDNSALSLASGVNTLIPFNQEVYDTDNMHDNVTNNSRITLNTSGLYEFDWFFTLPGAAYTQLDLNIRLNAAGAAGGGSSVRTQPYSDGVRGNGLIHFRHFRLMTAGDHLEAFIQQTSGGPRALSATSLGTRCFARWVASS